MLPQTGNAGVVAFWQSFQMLIIHVNPVCEMILGQKLLIMQKSPILQKTFWPLNVVYGGVYEMQTESTLNNDWQHQSFSAVSRYR